MSDLPRPFVPLGLPAFRRPGGRSMRLFSALLLALPAFAAPAQAVSVQGEATVRFSASSTLHDFEGSAAPVAFFLAPDERGRWAAEVDVPVAALQTGNARRDDNMRAMLDAESFPVIRASFRDIDPDAVRASGELPFALSIRSVSRPIRATVTDWTQVNDNELHFAVQFPLSLADFALEAPGVLFIRVGDAVQLTVRVSLRRS